jgi:hypothetical protein
MPTYEVTWTQIIAAKNHRNAAEKAVAIMHKTKEPKPILLVKSRQGSWQTIDLAEQPTPIDEEE